MQDVVKVKIKRSIPAKSHIRTFKDWIEWRKMQDIITNIENHVIVRRITGEDYYYISGVVIIDGIPKYDFMIDKETGKQSTCGYGKGCFWSNWQ